MKTDMSDFDEQELVALHHFVDEHIRTRTLWDIKEKEVDNALCKLRNKLVSRILAFNSKETTNG